MNRDGKACDRQNTNVSQVGLGWRVTCSTASQVRPYEGWSGLV